MCCPIDGCFATAIVSSLNMGKIKKKIHIEKKNAKKTTRISNRNERIDGKGVMQNERAGVSGAQKIDTIYNTMCNMANKRTGRLQKKKNEKDENERMTRIEYVCAYNTYIYVRTPYGTKKCTY